MTVELRGERVTLRPLRLDELDVLRAARSDPSYGGGPATDADDRRLRARIARSGRLVDGWLDLGVEADGRLVGDVGARRPPGSLPPGVFEFGITIFDPSDRGKGYGVEAAALLTEHLFEAHGAARVQASTAVSNAPMRGVLRRLGFREEGTLRGFMPATDGRRDDYVLAAVLRDEWARQGSKVAR